MESHRQAQFFRVTVRDDDLLSPAAAAEIAERSVRTIRRAYSSGRLNAYRDRSGRGVRILYRDLRGWMMGEEIAPRGPGADQINPTAAVPASPLTPREQNLALLRTARGKRRRSRQG
jgi:excisionase family DNA binding protein